MSTSTASNALNNPTATTAQKQSNPPGMISEDAAALASQILGLKKAAAANRNPSKKNQ